MRGADARCTSTSGLDGSHHSIISVLDFANSVAFFTIRLFCTTNRLMKASIKLRRTTTALRSLYTASRGAAQFNMLRVRCKVAKFGSYKVMGCCQRCFVQCIFLC